jgi:signal transduction histidine kinase
MKTPLIAIGSCARRLIKKSYSDQEKDKLGLIIRETDRMESMTKNMLDFSSR